MAMEGAKRHASLVTVLATLALAGCATMGADDGSEGALVEPSAADAIVAGDEAARLGDLERALAHYLRAVSIEETLDAWLRIGAASDGLGQMPRAAAAYEKVLQLDPDHIEANEGLGLAHLALGNEEAASAHLGRAVALDARRWRSHNGLGIVADRSKDHAAAIAHYRAALEANPRSPVVQNNLGYSRYLAGDWEEAARDFYRVTQSHADYKPAWSNLGMVYAEQGWYTDAINVFTRMIDKSKAYNEVGYIAYRRGDLAQAEQLLSEAVRLSPTYYQAAHENLTLVRARLQDRETGTDRALPLTGTSRTRIPVIRDEG